MDSRGEVVTRVRNLLEEATPANPPRGGSGTLPPFTVFLLVSALFLTIWGESMPSMSWRATCLIAAGVYFLAGCARLYAHGQHCESVADLLRTLRRKDSKAQLE